LLSWKDGLLSCLGEHMGQYTFTNAAADFALWVFPYGQFL